MVSLSVLVHATAIAVLLFAPGGWLTRSTAAPPTVMTITLSGGNGPANGGMTAMGGRPVQAAAAAPAVVKRAAEPVRVPAVKTPQMTVPTPVTPIKAAPAPVKAAPTVAKSEPAPAPVKAAATVAKNEPAPAPVVQPAPEEAKGRVPTTGPQPTTGSTIADTGTRGQGFGLSTGGGPGAGSTLDVADFCCPDYLVLMTERIKSAWTQHQGVGGQTVVKFTIQRDGRLTDPIVERQSGYPALDIAALRAVVVAKQLPPLPGAFPNPSLTVHLNFAYQP
jgi:TonB family protein